MQIELRESTVQSLDLVNFHRYLLQIIIHTKINCQSSGPLAKSFTHAKKRTQEIQWLTTIIIQRCVIYDSTFYKNYKFPKTLWL